jgi:hypothetical protein
MTIHEHISAIKALLKLETKDALPTDSLVYDQMLIVRNLLLNQKLNRNKVINAQNYQQFCIGLEQDKYHDCDCIPSGCNVLKSTVTLPKFLSNNNGLLMSVRTIDGQELSYIPSQLIKAKLNSRYQANKVSYDIQNNKLIIFGTLDLKAILISGILEDPSELSEYNYCGNNNNENCFDIDTEDFPIDADLVYNMRDLVQQRLLQTYDIKQDLVNDNNG